MGCEALADAGRKSRFDTRARGRASGTAPTAVARRDTAGPAQYVYLPAKHLFEHRGPFANQRGRCGDVVRDAIVDGSSRSGGGRSPPFLAPTCVAETPR